VRAVVAFSQDADALAPGRVDFASAGGPDDGAAVVIGDALEDGGEFAGLGAVTAGAVFSLRWG